MSERERVGSTDTGHPGPPAPRSGDRHGVANPTHLAATLAASGARPHPAQSCALTRRQSQQAGSSARTCLLAVRRPVLAAMAGERGSEQHDGTPDRGRETLPGGYFST